MADGVQAGQRIVHVAGAPSNGGSPRPFTTDRAAGRGRVLGAYAKSAPTEPWGPNVPAYLAELGGPAAA